MKMKTYSGGCLCGQVRYEAEGDPDRVVVCHCRYCQLRTGSPFGSLVYFDTSRISVIEGSLSKYEFLSESGTQKMGNAVLSELRHNDLGQSGKAPRSDSHIIWNF